MAKDTETLPLELQGGTNLTKVKADANKLAKAIKKLKTQRKEINDQISAHRENLVAMGIPRSSQSEAERRDAMVDAEKRREHDMGAQIYGEAIGTPVDLFESADEKSDKNQRSQPKETSARKAPAKKAAAKAPAKKAAPKGPKVVGSKKKTGVADGEAVDLSGNVVQFTGQMDGTTGKPN